MNTAPINGVIYVDDFAKIPAKATPIPNWPGWWEFNGELYGLNGQGIWGSVATPSSPSKSDTKFIEGVVDIVDDTMEQLDNVTDQGRYGDSLKESIKANGFDRILDELEKLLEDLEEI